MSIEVMKMALEVMESAIKAGDWVVDGACDPDMVLIALRQALEQQPAAWVGLTDEEIQTVVNKVASGEYQYSDTFARAIEAKLKEKNR